MTVKTLDLNDILAPDQLALRITDTWLDYDMRRNLWKHEIEEVTRYIYATDTTKTSNSKLPWKNKTTIPKLCQIFDNLFANYMATLFPQRKWLIWEANEKSAESVEKRDSITNYMNWAISQLSFKHEIEKVALDYIQAGNCLVTADWVDERVEGKDKTSTGYVGPVARRINPMDLVMNPTTPSFGPSPKIVRSFVTLGTLKKELERMSTDDNREEYENLWAYLKEIRNNAQSFQGNWDERDRLYQMDGFTSFRDYLSRDVVEVLTFYGDIYDRDNDIFYENHVITVVDRHKLINKKPNPSYFPSVPIFHSCWRKRQDNLWGMGPLVNLVGLQYRLDHLENLKADAMDFAIFPVQKVKGFVEDYNWGPGEKIFLNEDADVDLVQADVSFMQVMGEMQNIERLMEEMAGAPKEAMGFRTPGEKTKYEVQRMENAASRIFQNKIKQFEEQIIEPLLNAMLELARRNLTGTTTIKVFDDEFKTVSFETLTAQDITGVGRIKPVASRHFAEQAELIQNLTGLTNSGLWPAVQPHFSTIKLAKIIEKAFNLEDYEVVLKDVAIAEQAEMQRMAHALEEQTMSQVGTASGMGSDFDMPMQASQPQG